MDLYLSTYRKDYLWPCIRMQPASQKSSFPTTEQSKEKKFSRVVSCICGAEPGEHVLSEKCETFGKSLSREPATQVEEYPVRTGPSPEAEATRFDQPNAYMKKIQEKYPYLYDILKSSPPEDLMQRVNKARMRSTYQTDYCHDQLDRAFEDQEAAPREGPGDSLREPECRPHVKPKDKHSRRTQSQCDKDEKKKSKNSGAWDDEGIGRKTPLPPWKSEYQDVIGKTGYAIIKDKIHHEGNAFKIKVLGKVPIRCP